MPLTFSQGIERNIYNSFVAYINQNVKTGYDQSFGTPSGTNTLGVMLELPDDPTLTPPVPLIVFNKLINNLAASSIGMGDRSVYQYYVLRLNCYPDTNKNNTASALAESTLRNYMGYAFNTALYVPIQDYTVSGNPIVEVAEITDSRIVEPTTIKFGNLSTEQNRFDMVIHFKIPYFAING